MRSCSCPRRRLVGLGGCDPRQRVQFVLAWLVKLSRGLGCCLLGKILDGSELNGLGFPFAPCWGVRAGRRRTGEVSRGLWLRTNGVVTLLLLLAGHLGLELSCRFLGNFLGMEF